MSDYYAPPESVFPLFACPAPSVRGSITSAAAADAMDAKTLTRLHRLVLEYLRSRPEGATDEEIATALDLNPSTERPRRIELARRGLVIEAGTRKTASGRNATTWRTA